MVLSGTPLFSSRSLVRPEAPLLQLRKVAEAHELPTETRVNAVTKLLDLAEYDVPIWRQAGELGEKG
eukprot:13787309-Alexandrium_andersonii.AAC.1